MSSLSNNRKDLFQHDHLNEVFVEFKGRSCLSRHAKPSGWVFISLINKAKTVMEAVVPFS